MRRTIFAGIALGTSLAIAPNAHALCVRCDDAGCSLVTQQCPGDSLPLRPSDICRLIESLTGIHCTVQ
jgi:hypothetical protein